MRHGLMALLLGSTLFTSAAPALAAQLRAYRAITGAEVRLSDLFTDVPPDSDPVLGPGPAPGGQITVEAPQAAAIATEFGVDWQPVSGAERAVIERVGKPLSRDAVLAALRRALDASGVSADAEITLPDWTAPMVSPDAKADPEISQLDYDADSGRFTALLSIVSNDMPPVQSRVSGRVEEMVELPVASRRLLPGDVIGPEDLQMQRIRRPHLAGPPVRQPADAVGMAVRHPVMAGEPLLAANLVRPPLIRRGAEVLLTLDEPGLTLTGQGQALDSGALGERIRVLNPVSRAVLEAQVVGESRARVLPGSTPLIPARGDARLFAAAPLPRLDSESLP
ncbi:MAG TPA: flagellar basal body P-ring formation chaperone FlgA [Acetobacteraceae bacterium]|nr:flagellar basal body P-ring formation chaperone FlgA [Acetobacteraceae bacterium]